MHDMKLTESERGEAFEAMRRRSCRCLAPAGQDCWLTADQCRARSECEMLRLDDHVPLDIGQATRDDSVWMGIFAAVGAGVLAPFVVLAVIYAARVVGSGG
jgi:hypothetical protein